MQNHIPLREHLEAKPAAIPSQKLLLPTKFSLMLCSAVQKMLSNKILSKMFSKLLSYSIPSSFQKISVRVLHVNWINFISKISKRYLIIQERPPTYLWEILLGSQAYCTYLVFFFLVFFFWGQNLALFVTPIITEITRSQSNPEEEDRLS